MTAARFANECIYCGRTDGPLTKEHVIARSLGGDIVLQRASCKKHGDITSALETGMSRETYGVQRALDGVPTRDKESREALMSKKVPITGLDSRGEEVTVEISRSDCPRMPMVVHLPTPGLLQGLSPDIEASVGLTFGLDTTQSSKISRKLGLRDIVWSSAGIHPRTVMRVLAKTAHAFACYELGVNGFQPLLLPLIIDDVGSASYFVGGFEPERKQHKQPLLIREQVVASETYLIAEISLKYFPDMPLYQVVIGKPLRSAV